MRKEILRSIGLCFKTGCNKRRIICLLESYTFFYSKNFNECPDLTLKSIHTRSLYISRHTLDLFHILQKQPREEFDKVYPLKQPNLKS